MVRQDQVRAITHIEPALHVHAIRDELAARGVEVMDGDLLGWEWKLGD